MTTKYSGRIALEAIDDVVAQKPQDDARLSAATKCLCVFRDHVIVLARRGRAGRLEAATGPLRVRCPS